MAKNPSFSLISNERSTLTMEVDKKSGHILIAALQTSQCRGGKSSGSISTNQEKVVVNTPFRIVLWHLLH